MINYQASGVTISPTDADNCHEDTAEFDNSKESEESEETPQKEDTDKP